MPTISLRVSAPDELQEVVIAELAELGFTAFEQDGAAIRAYIDQQGWSDDARRQLSVLLQSSGSAFAIEEELVIPDENWNARWEAGIRPVATQFFVVAPPWAVLPLEHRRKQSIVIEPKMSFGTGNHASTRLALDFLPQFVTPGSRVLDAGCGSGILAIAALLLGAKDAFAFDIDGWAVPNARENAERNDVAGRFTVEQGSVAIAPAGPYDIICANINRNALVGMLPELERRLGNRGHLIMSGLLIDDRSTMLTAAERVGLAPASEASEEGWWAAALHRPTREA